MKAKSLVVGLALLTSGTVIGISTQQFASADVSSGDRPVLVPIESCRLVDTRPGDATVGPRSSPLGTADTMTVDTQQSDTDCTGAIPADALSLALNVTAIGATEQSFLTIWAGGDRPDASSLNPSPGAPPTPNAVTVDLSIDSEFMVYNNAGNVNIIADVVGYYDNHNHDDRYYTQDQIDDNFVNQAQQPEFLYATNTQTNPATILRSSPGVTMTNDSTGTYNFTFPRDITSCAWSATLGGGQILGNLLPVLNDLGISASQGNSGLAVAPDEIVVSVFDDTTTGAPASFMLTVTCP